MRFDSILVELSATPLYLLALFIFLLVVFHLVLVKWLKLGDVAWKRIDYVWLGAAALGVLASSAQADRFLSNLHLQGVEATRTEFAYRTLRADLADPPGVCLPRVRSEYSPPDFDDIVKEQQAICQWAKATAASMPDIPPMPFPPLEDVGFKPFPRPAKYEEGVVKRINQFAEAYRQQQKRYATFADSLRTSAAEEMFMVLGPLLLAFALALRITKVSGEIALARA
jgi:hypothetical protein